MTAVSNWNAFLDDMEQRFGDAVLIKRFPKIEELSKVSRQRRGDKHSVQLAFIRHECTNYDELVGELRLWVDDYLFRNFLEGLGFGGRGVSRLVRSLREWCHELICAKYPHLWRAKERDRELRSRHPSKVKVPFGALQGRAIERVRTEWLLNALCCSRYPAYFKSAVKEYLADLLVA